MSEHACDSGDVRSSRILLIVFLVGLIVGQGGAAAVYANPTTAVTKTQQGADLRVYLPMSNQPPEQADVRPCVVEVSLEPTWPSITVESATLSDTSIINEQNKDRSRSKPHDKDLWRLVIFAGIGDGNNELTPNGRRFISPIHDSVVTAEVGLLARIDLPTWMGDEVTIALLKNGDVISIRRVNTSPK